MRPSVVLPKLSIAPDLFVKHLDPSDDQRRNSYFHDGDPEATRKRNILRMRTQRPAALAAALLLGSFATQAHATELTPGGFGVVPDAQADPLASGTVLASIVN